MKGWDFKDAIIAVITTGHKVEYYVPQRLCGMTSFVAEYRTKQLKCNTLKIQYNETKRDKQNWL